MALPTTKEFHEIDDSQSNQKETSGTSISRLINKTIRILINRWFILVCSAAVCGLLATVLSGFLSAKTFVYTGVLLYQPIPVAESYKELDPALDFKTIQNFIKLPKNMLTLKTEYDLDVPLKLIDLAIDVNTRTAPNTMEINVEWDDEDLTRQLTNSVMKNFADQIKELREKKMDGIIEDIAQRSTICGNRLDAAKKKLRSFQNQHGILDYNKDRLRIQKEIENYEQLIEKEKRENNNTIAQMERMESLIKNLKDDAKKKAEESAKFDAAQDTITNNRRRQDRLRELIEEERSRIALKAQLKVKQEELDRVTPLFRDRLITKQAYDAVLSDVKVLQAKLNENERILAYQKELKNIDKVVVPSKSNTSVGSPIIQQMLNAKLELELKLIAIEKETLQLVKVLEESRLREEELANLEKEHHGLINAIEVIDSELRRIKEMQTIAEQLKTMDVREIMIVQEAAPAKISVKSNRKILFVGMAGGSFALCFLGILGFDFLRLRNSHQDALFQLGLPILYEKKPGKKTSVNDHGVNDDCTRKLALQIRQALPNAGDVVGIAPTNSLQACSDLICRLSDYLSKRDERVLILDLQDSDRLQSQLFPTTASINYLDNNGENSDNGILSIPKKFEPNSQMGLQDYLNYVVEETHEFVHPTDNPAIDYLPNHDQQRTDMELLATHRMRELMEKLKNRYTIIVVATPPLTRHVDFQIVAAYLDGTMFQINGGESVDPTVLKEWQSIVDQNLPVLGVAVL